MTKTDMRLVGGPPKRLPMSCYEIKYAEASNTRLMGVVGLCVHWVLREDCREAEALRDEKREPVGSIFQIYCFELEEGGLDRAGELIGQDHLKLSEMKNNVFGGLGGALKRLDQREALWLIAGWSGEGALSAASRLPAGVREAIKIARDLEEAEPLGDEEKRKLVKKLCVRVTTDYGLINYYIMRSVCFDREGAELLESPLAAAADLGPLHLKARASLIRNECKRTENEDGTIDYLCESVLDTDTGSWIMTSRLRTDGLGVCFCEKLQAFRVSSWENMIKLSRPEYLTYFDIDDDPDELRGKLAKRIPRATSKIYDSGVLYMNYKTDNSHVELPVFNIGDDLKASYFVTAAGQLVAASFSLTGIIDAESMISVSGLENEMTLKGRYSFAGPVLGPFVESGFGDFEEFLGEIIGEES